MRLLTLLRETTGKRFSVFSLRKTPQQLGLDSLTFTDLILNLEERYGVKIPDTALVNLYRTRLREWRSYLIFRQKRHGAK